MSPERVEDALCNFAIFARAARVAVRTTVLDARANGWPLVVTRDGVVVHLPADWFVLLEEADELRPATAGEVAVAVDDPVGETASGAATLAE